MRLATQTDISGIMAIVRQTIAQMHSEGNTQWDENYPAADDFLGDVAAGTLYVATENEAILGFACINGEEPAEYADVPWRQGVPALVVHRMAVAKEARGKGVAKKMMLYAEALARQKGIGYIKVDTYSKNPAMNGLLLSLEYVLVGHMHFKGKPELFGCYDKKISGI